MQESSALDRWKCICSGNHNQADAYIRISTGNVTVDSDITMNGDFRRNYVLFTGNGSLYLGGAISGGTITSNTGGGNQAPTSGTVIYNGSAVQTITDYAYYNLETDNSSGLTLTTDITVSNSLTLTSGDITTGSNTLILSNSTSANLVYTSGTITGNLQRAINTPTGTEYLFPVGTASNTNPLKITFTNLSAGDLTLSFQEADIGTSGLPLNDAGVSIIDRFSEGYWTLIASGGLASTDYDVTLDYTGFTGVSNGSRIIKRTAGGNLTVDGTHGTVSSPEISRTSLSDISTTSTDLAIGKSGLSISSHPDNYSGCAPVFSVVASGSPPLTYQWQEDDGSGFSDLTDDAMYSGTNTADLSITGATPAMSGYQYRCIVSDATSSTETSNAATFNYSLPSVYLGFSYSLDITINAASGSSDLTDFPVLVSFADALLRSESNGGHVTSDSGYDIVFFDQSGGKLDHQLEHFDPVTGEFVGWVRIPLLSSSSTTTINMLYGNNAVTTDQSVETVWISSYKGIWHLNGTDYTDATSYSNDGTNSNTGDVTGKIAGGRSFSGSGSYIQVSTNGFVPNDNNQTISIWANMPVAPTGNRNLISFQNAVASSAIQLGFRGGNTVAWKWGGVILANAGSYPSLNTWHYYVYTYDGTTSRIYVDGTEINSSTVAPQTALPSEGNIGRYNDGEYIIASLDEPRFSISPKSSGWILTEYNNQNNPSSFISLGTESSNGFLTSIGECSSTYTLDQGYPSGGVYSGTGVSGTNFDASVAGVGTHSITYTYTDPDGCTNFATKDIIVTAVPSAPTASDRECCVSNILDLEATGTNLKWYSDAALTSLLATGTPFATGETTAGTYTYYVTQTVNGCESTSTQVSQIILGTTNIDTQPQAQNICEGDNAVFNISVSGYGLSYQWQEDGIDISDGGIYSGTTTASLTLTDPGLANSGKQYRCVVSSTCTGSSLNSDYATLTVTPIPVATFSYSGTPYCPTDSDPSPTFSGGGVAGTFSSTAGLVFINTATGEVDLSASTPGIYTVTNTIAAAGGCGEVSENNTIEILGDQIWTGAIDTDWNTAGNWSCNYLPHSGSSVVIPDVANKPVLSTGVTGSLNNLTIDSGSSLEVTGNTLQIAGTISNSGTLSARSGTIEMNGSAAQVIGPGVFQGDSILNLIVNNASGVSITGTLGITGIVYPVSGELESNGNLILKSGPAETALIDGSGSGTVSGNVTIQRYLDQGFGYKYISSPFQSSTVSELADDIDLAFWYPTLFKYDESRTTSGWVAHNNPADALIPIYGYAANFGSVLDADTFDVSGVVNNGALSVTLYNNNNTYTQGMNLVGNPYPSPIDWDAAAGWTKTNIDDAIYFFKASSTDQYGGTYSSYIAGISSDGVVTNIIPSMQGFFVHVSDGAYPVTGTLGVNNSVRVTDKTQSFSKSKSGKSKSSSYPLIRISAEFSDDQKSIDPSVIYFHPFANSEYDFDTDALKLLNTDFGVPNIYSLLSDGKKLSINSLPENIEFPVRIPLGLKTNRPGEIIIKLRDLDSYFENKNIYLYDALTSVNQPLLNGGAYNVSLPSGEYHNRFYLDLSQVATSIPEEETDLNSFSAFEVDNILRVNIYDKPESGASISIINLLGQVVNNYRISYQGVHEYPL